MIIDAHQHLFKGFAGEIGVSTPEEFVNGFKSRGVDKGIVGTFDGYFSDYKAANDELHALMVQYPDTVQAWCVIDPRDGEDAIEELDRCINGLGMAGLELNPWIQAVSTVDPCMFPLLEEAAHLKIPILYHDGTAPYCTVDQVAYIAGRYPDMPIILGGGGLMDYARGAVRAAVAHDNVLLACSGGRMDTYRRVVDVVGAERIVWASAYAFGGPEGIPYHLDKVESLGLSDDDKEKVFGRNILRIVPALA